MPAARMSCVLRITASPAWADRLSSALEPYRVDEHPETPCLHCIVSDAGYREFAEQLEDAAAFLEEFGALLRAATDEGADGALDFGIAKRDVAAQYDRFPARLVRLAGEAGLGLELSVYPLGDD
jgi:hypothetical protein